MLHELDTALRALVEREIGDDGEVEIDFDAPTKDWASHRNQPTIDIYLYDIRQDVTPLPVRRGRRARRRRHRRPQRRPQPKFFRLAYLVTAWTQRAEDEHRLLSALMVDVPAPRDRAAGAARRLARRPRHQHPAGRRPAAAAGPRAVRRVVGARRRAQAVARRQPRSPRCCPSGSPRPARRCTVEPVLTMVDRRHRRRRDARRPADAARTADPAIAGRRRPPPAPTDGPIARPRSRPRR